jgi:ribosomal protein S6--L-glutamate ligase
MKRLLVLTAKPDLAIYRSVEAAGGRAGVAVDVVDTGHVVARAFPPFLSYHEDPLSLDDVAAALPRVGNWRPDSTLAVVETVGRLGIPLLNGPGAIRAGRDHWLTVQILAQAGLPHPLTVAGSDPETLAAQGGTMSGFPCVVKQRHSRQGVGVILCQTQAELEAVLDSLWRLGDEVVVQRFCRPGGISRRLLVVRGEVLGAAEHRAGKGEFRANAARGAKVAGVEPTPQQAMLAVNAARALSLGFCGIDLLPDGEEWVIGEVNPTPGWRHFAKATGVAVADHVVAALLAIGRDVGAP